MDQYGINAKFLIRGITLTYVDIMRIRQPLATELIPRKLSDLENEKGFNRFEEIVSDPNWPGNVNDSIALDPDGALFSITNGRHRVFLAKRKGYKAVWARIIGG